MFSTSVTTARGGVSKGTAKERGRCSSTRVSATSGVSVTRMSGVRPGSTKASPSELARPLSGDAGARSLSAGVPGDEGGAVAEKRIRTQMCQDDFELLLYVRGSVPRG